MGALFLKSLFEGVKGFEAIAINYEASIVFTIPSIAFLIPNCW
jgi:hypothetical protein